MGLMFGDLHAKTSRLAQDLDEDGRLQTEDSGLIVVEGAPLEIQQFSVPDENGGSNLTTRISVNEDEQSEALLSVSEFRVEPDAEPEPTMVNGNRGNETDPDFSLVRIINNGRIVVKLGGAGIVSGPAEHRGIAQYQSTARLEKLNKLDLIRIERIMSGILDNITAARLIMDGYSTAEAFEKAGKELPMTEAALLKIAQDGSTSSDRINA